MSATHVGIVWNPSKPAAGELEAALEVALAQEDDPAAFTVSWWETAVDDPGRAATRAALDAGATLVVAAGGDGTVRAVAEELAESGASAELGIIPLGTGNLLARNLEVPLNDLFAAFRRALTTAARPIDVGWAEVTGPDRSVARHAFVVMAGFGIDAHMIAETDDELKSRAGWLAYVESLGRAVAASEVISLRISRDGGEPVAEQAHTLIVGNCGMLQGGVTLLPDADPADGELDVLVLRADGIAGWADTLRNVVWDNGLKRMLTGGTTAESSEHTEHARARELVVEMDEPRPVEIDGDEVGEAVRLSLSVQPGGVRVR